MRMWLRHCLQLQLPMRMSAELKLYCISPQCCPSRFDAVEWLMHWRFVSSTPRMRVCFAGRPCSAQGDSCCRLAHNSIGSYFMRSGVAYLQGLA
jgi:hypothetical protein